VGVWVSLRVLDNYLVFIPSCSVCFECFGKKREFVLNALVKREKQNTVGKTSWSKIQNGFAQYNPIFVLWPLKHFLFWSLNFFFSI
jgi:hypothetical protein